MGEKPRVLIVDDDPAVCGMLRTFLGARGYHAITAASADEALQRFHGDHPDAVLLDIVIPGQHGRSGHAGSSQENRSRRAGHRNLRSGT